ncbi:MAG: DUF4062 domain-containing protein [Desulfobacter sp.]|nr:DUF4062 domain-containing protein [Desulfobacter sp.]WDP87034.1 MAG: DUF4062 domain-containing protein [Desulfobacter sp.]
MEIRLKNTRQNREIRVFISSTFLDMQKERDYLLKNSFLKLKALCEKRSVSFKEVDLRWGITEEESRQGRVLPICLEEINHCRPYFIGLLGERYGWVPDQIPKQVVDQEKWVKKHRHKSVTELEILHGVLNDPHMAEHAFFYFRDPDVLNSLPEQERSRYEERPSPEDIQRLGLKKAVNQSSQKKKQLAQLKHQIRKSGFKVRENFKSLRELGALVEKDLISIINAKFPEDEENLSEHTLEAIAQETFCIQKSEIYIGGEKYFEQLNALIDQENPFINISGESGVGKSAFLAAWVSRAPAKYPGTIWLTHFVGASSRSSDYKQILKRFIHELAGRYHLSVDLPQDLKDIHLIFQRVLEKIPKTFRVVILIDSLNTLSAQGLSKGAHSHFPGYTAGTGLCMFAICFRQFQRPAL